MVFWSQLMWFLTHWAVCKPEANIVMLKFSQNQSSKPRSFQSTSSNTIQQSKSWELFPSTSNKIKLNYVNRQSY